MTAAYRMRGLGWFLSVVIVTLGFYLVSLQVAAERKKVADMDRKIIFAQREIRALETEFDTRANLAQLERWNGEIFALTAPSSDQFVANEATLASIDLNAPAAMGMQTRTADYIVPSAPRAVEEIMPAPAPAAPPVIAPQPPRGRTMLASVAAVQPHLGGQRPQAVAMLDRKLLSESTIGDLMNSARAEAVASH